ncbi:aldehyde dehydrogenase family protein [Sediminibacillus massiliensis]|uniref:aldehyde dehydrogenase family protein n=1 Tax=Sediminibacillus massiliensis TaxID=1926277 RepID=UPI00098834C2|nr:aldehyde dehydrogenase family protein [Sediminibacillus massiliensis]
MNITHSPLVATNWINGKWEIGNGERSLRYNPANVNEPVGEIAFSSQKEVALAEKAAHQALPHWRKLTGNQRANYLYAMATALENNTDEIAELATREMGKPIGEMKGEVARGIQLLKYYAAEGVRADGDVIPSSANGVLQYTKRIALGVVGLITPWNFPVAIPIWKLAPALICGNTIIWKPAENGSLTAYKLCRIFEEADLPEGVINLVIGKGKEVGTYLTEEAEINGLSFTGSTYTGTRLAGVCAQRNIKYQTEMGGKNAAIVLNDADLNTAVPAIVSGTFRSAGQKCTASSRIIVEEGIYDSFIEAIKSEMEKVKLTNPLDKDAYLGPVASKEQHRKVNLYVELAKKESNIIHENKDELSEDGYYVNPLVIEGISKSHPLFQDEIFGPIAAVLKVKDYQEAIDTFNDTKYGLSGSVFTTNLAKAHQFLEDAEAGMVRVNLETAGVEYQAPFGGLKQSSSHTREQGQEALKFYSNIKTCAIKYE